MERGGKAESGEIRYLKEANRKLLQQNHKLLSEMERCSQDLQGARSKVMYYMCSIFITTSYWARWSGAARTSRGLGQRYCTCITFSNDKEFSIVLWGAAAVEWLSSWYAEQGFQGSYPCDATSISEIGYLLPSRDIAEILLKQHKILKKTHQPIPYFA